MVVAAIVAAEKFSFFFQSRSYKLLTTTKVVSPTFLLIPGEPETCEEIAEEKRKKLKMEKIAHKKRKIGQCGN